MKDGIIKGSGNSRFLKSVENFKTLYPTYDAFVSALAAGTLPVDFNGINAAGWEQIGDALGKNTLLKDATAALFGLGADAVPDDVLAVIKSTFNSQAEDIASKAKIATGKYNGTGTSGSSNAKSLTFDFAPRIIILTHDYFDADVIDIGGWRDLINRGFAYGTSGKNTQIIINADTLTTSYQSGLGFAVEGSYTPSAKKSADGKTITWYGSNAASQANETKHTYYYVAIG